MITQQNKLNKESITRLVTLLRRLSCRKSYFKANQLSNLHFYLDNQPNKQMLITQLLKLFSLSIEKK